TGNVVDDLPDDHPVSQDLRFIEQNFNGIMPFEVMIDTRRPNGVTSAKTLRNIDRMQDLFVGYPQFSKPVSIVEGIKFTKQAFYNGDPEKYTLISNQEKAFFKDYLDNAQRHERFLDDFIDSTQRYTRVSMNMADIGTAQMDFLLKDITRQVDSIFNPKKPLADSLFALLKGGPNDPPRDSVMLSIYKRFPRVKRGIREAYQADSPLAADSAYWEALAEDPTQIKRVHDSPDFTKRLEEVLGNQFYRIDYTGQATVFLKGTNYLVKNLFVSLSIAVVIVALIMAIFFASFRMIVISLVTNLIPLLLTAGLMGYFQIAIKPSTILVFSVAFGISVDDTIHFLAKYRQELKYYNHNIGPAVVGAL
ncbi:MAG: MMPL family transporter, partial [Bacteroidota bacterium]